MDEINKALGLKADAGVEEALAAIAGLKQARSGIPKGLNPENIERRRNAGLTKDEAIDVETRQVKNDSAAEKKGNK